MQGLIPVNLPPSETTIQGGQKRTNEEIPENPYQELERIITLEKKSLEDTNKKVIEITHNIETRARNFTQAKPSTRDTNKTIKAITLLKAKNNEYQCLIKTQKDQRDKIDELEKAKTKPEAELKTFIKDFIEYQSLPTLTFSEEENNEIMDLFKEWDKPKKSQNPTQLTPEQ